MAKKPEITEVPEEKKPGTELVDWRAKLGAMTQRVIETEQPDYVNISFKGGIFTINEEPVANNRLEMIILDYRFENAWYRDNYNPNRPTAPHCWALSYEGVDMVPSEKSEERQSDLCDTCPKNEWGSDRNGGRGKDCKNSRRLAVIPASIINEGPNAVRKATVGIIKLPTTSIKNFQKFAQQVSNVLHVPPLGVVVEISVTPDPSSQFKVNFKVMEQIEDGEIIKALITKSETDAKVELDKPYLSNAELQEMQAQRAGAGAGAGGSKY